MLTDQPLLVFQDMIEDILLQVKNSYQVMCDDSNKTSPFALVIDGRALEIALKSEVKDQFLRLAVNCASVICCRVSPKQKALVRIDPVRYSVHSVFLFFSPFDSKVYKPANSVTHNGICR